YSRELAPPSLPTRRSSDLVVAFAQPPLLAEQRPKSSGGRINSQPVPLRRQGPISKAIAFPPRPLEPAEGRRWTPAFAGARGRDRSEEHTSELQSRENLACR